MHSNDHPEASDMSRPAQESGLSGKIYYSISEVSDMCGIKTHVLRYWESEFPSLRPRKGRGGSRRYRRRDIEEVLAIKSLLHDQGYRIAGARKVLAQRHQRVHSDTGDKDGFDCPAASAPTSLRFETSMPESDQLVIPFGRLDRTAQLVQMRHELQEVLALVRDLAPRKSRSAQN